MSKVRALIVGVSDYSLRNGKNLSFCKNDIYAMKNACVQGLNVDPADILLCGETGLVRSEDFISALRQIIAIAENDDTLLLYFSGHGKTIEKNHYLVFSDKIVKTQELIECLENIKAKNKVLFLDCCLAGNFTVDASAVFSIDETVDQFANKGYAVFASCNEQQYSYAHPDMPISLFTYFLCQALTFEQIVRGGKKSLYDIHKLLFMLLDGWNKNHPEKMQHPIYRANIGGSIFFDIQDYHPYVIDEFFSDHESYTIYSVKPLHSPTAKRYSVQVILKKPMLFSEIATINHEIVKIVKPLNICQNKKQEEKWRNKDANLIFCCFGLDETDMKNSNYICRTTWADETQDKSRWYRLNKNSEIIYDIHFDIFTYYQSHKIIIEKHTATKEKIISETNAIITRMVTLGEQVIAAYNEYLNGTINEAAFKNAVNAIAPELTNLYFANADLDISPDELKDWSQHCSNLVGSIHDFTLYYSQKSFAERTAENRRTCMDMAIKQYYKDLEKLKEYDISQL